MFRISMGLACNISAEREMLNFFLVEDSLTVSSLSDCITKFLPRRLSRGEGPYGTQCLELKGHTWYLLRHKADCAILFVE